MEWRKIKKGLLRASSNSMHLAVISRRYVYSQCRMLIIFKGQLFLL
jgi:hypothetical protein